MKTNFNYLASLLAAGIVFGMTLACAAAPNVFITAPAPAPSTVTSVVPTSYVWDGNEYVGIVAGQDYYLGPGDVWIPASPSQVHRFEAYQASHPDWKNQMTTNEKYRYSTPAAGSTAPPGGKQNNHPIKFEKDNDYNNHTAPMRDLHNNQPLNDQKNNNSYNNHTNPP